MPRRFRLAAQHSLQYALELFVSKPPLTNPNFVARKISSRFPVRLNHFPRSSSLSPYKLTSFVSLWLHPETSTNEDLLGAVPKCCSQFKSAIKDRKSFLVTRNCPVRTMRHSHQSKAQRWDFWSIFTERVERYRLCRHCGRNEVVEEWIELQFDGESRLCEHKLRGITAIDEAAPSIL